MTTYNIETMKAYLPFGGARPNKFHVIVNNPVDRSGDIKFNFNCYASSIPEAAVGTIDVYYKGRPVKFLGDRPPFPNWTVSVYHDADALVRNTFLRWNSAMNAHQGNIMSGGITPNPYSYKSDAIITQTLMNDDIPFSTVKMIGLFPVRVGQMDVSWEDQNRIMTFEVEFAYDYWVSPTVTDGV